MYVVGKVCYISRNPRIILVLPYECLISNMDDIVDDVERSIATTCGQLVYVDSKSRVQVLHETAREFLLRPNNTSEFAIVRKEGHKRLAMVCLKYLCGDDMAGRLGNDYWPIDSPSIKDRITKNRSYR